MAIQSDDRPFDAGTGRIVPSTTQLHAAALAGSEAAWAALVERYTRLVWKVVRSFGFDQAASEDVVQLTWTRLVEHLETVRHPERLGGWLATTARNEALALVRRRRRLVPVGEIDTLDALPSWFDADVLVEADEESQVATAFATLSARDRELLLLLTADPPLGYAEIGEMLGRPVGSIGPSRGRAIERLRRALYAEQLRTGTVVGGVDP